jgi:predicted RNA-binding protein with PUA-like domain
MNYWLLKSEPSVFSIDDLEKCGRRGSGWDGVRNYQARNMLRDRMRKGDLAFLYHSSCEEPGITGIMEIASAGRPDPTAFDPRDHHYDPDSDHGNPRWYLVDVRLKRRLRRLISLEELRNHRPLSGMQLLKRGNRLSVMPVSKREWDYILKLERKDS